MKQVIAILGSTGSIGRQTLDVVRAYGDRLEVGLLTCHENVELLAKQAVEFAPAAVITTHEPSYDKLRGLLSNHPDIKVYCGAGAVEQEVQNNATHTVVTAVTGFAGLLPTIAAIRAGKKIALANKETLVVAGELVMKLAMECRAPILPVDSEHSAIFQCLMGEQTEPRKIIITASGGALRDMPTDQLAMATTAEVLSHPNWCMGAKITVDSATMLNKGFEVIEAQHLFGLRPDQIDVVIHPESVIHSMVEYPDGAVKAQLGTPDMRLPIQYALTFPERLPLIPASDYNPVLGGSLTFREVDEAKYPCFVLARKAMIEGGVMPTVLNAAGEVAVAQFLEHKIRFTEIAERIEAALGGIENRALHTLDDILEADRRTRHFLKNNPNQIKNRNLI